MEWNEIIEVEFMSTWRTDWMNDGMNEWMSEDHNGGDHDSWIQCNLRSQIRQKSNSLENEKFTRQTNFNSSENSRETVIDQIDNDGVEIAICVYIAVSRLFRCLNTDKDGLAHNFSIFVAFQENWF